MTMILFKLFSRSIGRIDLKIFYNLQTLTLGSLEELAEAGLAFPRNSWHCRCCSNVLTICSANTGEVSGMFASQ